MTEGSSVSYIFTATLSSASQGVTTITTDRGVITIANNQTTGTLVVPVSNGEDVYLDATSLTATITATGGGNFENLVIGTGTATASVTDTNDDTTVSLSGPSDVVEGATASNYVLTLNNTPVSAVTVTLSYSGAAIDGTDFTGVITVTIPSNGTSASFSISTLDDLLAETAESFTVSIAGISGGGTVHIDLGTGRHTG